MLVRRIARPLLASSFIYGGIDTLRHPSSRVPGARPIVETIADQADKQLPVRVPRDVETWIRVDAGVKVAAATLFALGKMPRIAALALSASIVPTTLAGHRFWEHDDPKERFGQTSHFLKNAGLLGGLLLASVDTEGRPSVGYRARRAARLAAEVTSKQTEKAQKKAAKAQKEAQKRARKQAKKVRS